MPSVAAGDAVDERPHQRRQRLHGRVLQAADDEVLRPRRRRGHRPADRVGHLADDAAAHEVLRAALVALPLLLPGGVAARLGGPVLPEHGVDTAVPAELVDLTVRQDPLARRSIAGTESRLLRLPGTTPPSLKPSGSDCRVIFELIFPAMLFHILRRPLL
jgi:hypothetical protein